MESPPSERPVARVAELSARLRSTSTAVVHDDAATRALYTMDASNHRHSPAAVVVARSPDDAAATVAAAAETGLTVVPRGGGTSLAGNAIGSGIVLDLTSVDRIVDVDPDRRTARVQPGVVLDDLRSAAAPHGLTFGPDPSTHSRCTLGGMIGNNSCGSHSVAWGTTADNVEDLDVVLADGTRMTVAANSRRELDRRAGTPGAEGRVHAALRELVTTELATIRRELGGFSRQVSGYALDWLLPEKGHHLARALVGTEGSCAVVVGATVRLVPTPPARALLVLGFPDDSAAAEAVPDILGHGPLTVEGMDARLVELSPGGRAQLDRAHGSLPAGGAWLFVEFGADDTAAAADRAAQVAAECESVPHAVVTDAAQRRALWRLREEGAGTATRLADGTEAWPGWEDAAVPPERLGSYLREFRALLSAHGLHGISYGHFGEGCVHVRIDFDLVTPAGVAAYRRFVQDAADLVARHGGSLSGEHGDGQVRSELLPRMYSAHTIELFERFKAAWDPDSRLNPGVVVTPRRLDDDLRFAAVQPEPPSTAFGYRHDDGDFAQAVRRCVGVGKCRNRADADGTAAGAVMCPSFQVTGEEKHSTRGRAHLLHEMLAGEVVTGGWRSTEVRDALDLCLSCKGCLSDCPVDVDMATYKAEFLHHHYARRPRPAAHYSMGWLPLWLRLGAAAPGSVGAALDVPAVSRTVKRAGGIAPERELPRPAPEPFTRWFRRRGGRASGPQVLLWPDTFTNHFSPGVGRAAVAVLRAAGFDPRLPSRSVCCGLTWVSTGQLGVARRVLRRTLRVLEPALSAGVPIVGLEPSCLSTLRGELPDLLPDDPRAGLVADRASTLAGFLAAHAPHWSPPRRERRALTQVHCHQHATLGVDAENTLLAAAGVDAQRVPSSCCGVAGNFGFERGHYAISHALGEQALLPAVRAAGLDTLIIADGFSCRTQIQQGSDRRAVHLAEVVADGLGDEPRDTLSDTPDAIAGPA
ncbi:FAD/FMN-containing dehydrogenase [Haloactinopolyspora alba]|uniref:FAD/FMN-containing dehydrogenase n=1 Tax=Haloactinopolyspora alba TaxID=648780 RepID=A0A2P8D9E2_9ACTN|nr:FAD-binding and (Fe-S)-binding domain-containing protein [Haloactinopolyspora alba]PSK93822.1 FAD/FMN-containing dehydrogenase [Haloactinopolyspora alba]